MSTFRVLYNLEVGQECTPTSVVPNVFGKPVGSEFLLLPICVCKVLSSKLMPTSDDEMAKTSSKSFCENFLRAGGLR